MRKIIRKIKERKKNTLINKEINKEGNKIIINSPQKKGIVIKVYNMTPKKPNSALRKVAKILIKGKGIIIGYIPGEKQTINSHNEVLITKGKIQDLVNVNYKIIRGKLDAKAPIRNKSRSKYGVKKEIISKSNK